MYADYVGELEGRNVEHVEHFEQLCKHEHEILVNSKNAKNLDELSEYKDNILIQIDSTLAPFFNPPSLSRDSARGSGAYNQQERIVEPYSELEDFLDNDDFSNLLSVIG